MPDKRLRGSTEYSSHPPTLRARARLQRLPEDKRLLEQAKNREYNAMWQSCTRVSRREEYRRASEPARRNMLLGNLRAVMEKRRENGKLIYGINEERMVERHLRKEATLRASQEGSRNVSIALQGVSIDNRTEFDLEAPSVGDNWLESEGAHDATEPASGMSTHAHQPVLGDYVDDFDMAQSCQDQLTDLDQGMQNSLNNQIHLRDLIDETLSAVASLAESSRRLDAKVDYLIHHLQHAPVSSRVAAHPAPGFTAHNVPMVPPMLPDGFALVNNFEAQQPLGQSHQQTQQQPAHYVADLAGV